MYEPLLPVLIRNGWKNCQDTFHKLKLFNAILDKIFLYFFTYWHRLSSPKVASETELDSFSRFPLGDAEWLRTSGHQEISIKSLKYLAWKANPHLVIENKYFVVLKNCKKIRQREREREREREKKKTCLQYTVQDCTICHCCTNSSYSNFFNSNLVISTYIVFFFLSGFLTNITIQKTAGEAGGYLLNSFLLLPSASHTLSY